MRSIIWLYDALQKRPDQGLSRRLSAAGSRRIPRASGWPRRVVREAGHGTPRPGGVPSVRRKSDSIDRSREVVGIPGAGAHISERIAPGAAVGMCRPVRSVDSGKQGADPGRRTGRAGRGCAGTAWGDLPMPGWTQGLAGHRDSGRMVNRCIARSQASDREARYYWGGERFAACRFTDSAVASHLVLVLDDLTVDFVGEEVIAA